MLTFVLMDGKTVCYIACGSANALLLDLGLPFECKMRVSKQGYGSLALPGEAKLLQVTGHPLCKLAQMPKESILHWSPEQPDLSQRLSALRFLQACLLCKHLSRGSAVVTAFCASGHILTLLKSSCHHLPPCCRRDFSNGNYGEATSE